MEEEVFTISITVSQPAAKIDGTVEIVDDYGISIVASQQGVELEGVAMSEISQTALIAFGQWYKGDPGRDGDDGRDGTDGFSPVVTVTPTEDGHEVTITDASGDHTFDVNDGVGIPQTLSLVGNELTLSYGGGTVTLPDGLPSQSGQSGKFLTTNGTEASWDEVPEQVNADWEASSGVAQILNKPALFSGNYNDLTNKPTLGSAAQLDVPSSGDASTSEVVLGNDSRLSDARTPLSHTHGNITNDGKVGNVSGKILTTGTGGEIQASDSITKSLISDFPTLATVATSGSYNDLSNKPSIPAAQIQADYKQTDSSAVDYIKNAPFVRIYRSLTGTAAVTAGSYTHAKWDVTDDTVAQYVDGMVVCIKVPVAGHGTYGTGLQINSLGYKPVVYNVSSMVSTRYSVGSVVWAVYNATQTASLYVNSSSASTITGCWQVMDYDINTTSIYTLQRYNGTRVVSADLLRYVIAFRKNETTIVPIHSVAGTGTSANTAVTSTNKTMTTESFDPFGEIYQYATNTKIATNESVNLSTLRTQCASVDARYIFNCNKTLTANRELYLVVDLQSDGMVKLATSINPWAQTLPSTDDGHLYILLGYAYSTYQMELYYYHPIYYHDGTQLRQYSGDKTGDTLPSQSGNSGKFLTTDGTSASWATVSAGSSTLSALTDTTISSPTANQILTYDNTTSKWVNADVPTELPSVSGNASKILAVNNGATGVEWVTKPSSGLTNYDFTHTANTTISSSTTTVTFAANTRGSQMITVSDDISILFVVNNDSDNYLWIENSDTTNNIDVTISSVTHNGNVVSSVRMPRDGIAVPAGGTCEIGIVCNTDGAFITSRDDLE